MSLFQQEKLHSSLHPSSVVSQFSSFKLLHKTFIPKLDSKVYFYTHPSGAEAVIFKNKDSMRRFSVGFNTIAENNAGLPHITEHLVLRRWKQLQSSNDAMASMLASTFLCDLNATTDSMFTNFFVASRSSADFHRLLRFCLDVTTAPALLQSDFNSEIARWAKLKGQGWYTTGTLLNEMRAENASAHSTLFNNAAKLLFEEHPLGMNFGGDPEEISKLSVKDVQDFYERNYCLSNSRFFAYGDVDPEQVIAQINAAITQLPALSDNSPKLQNRIWGENNFSKTQQIKMSNLPFACLSATHIASALESYSNEDLAFIDSVVFPSIYQDRSSQSLNRLLKDNGFQCYLDLGLHTSSPIPSSSITAWNLTSDRPDTISDFILGKLKQRQFRLSTQLLSSCYDENNLELQGILSSDSRGEAIMERVTSEWSRYHSAASLCTKNSFDISPVMSDRDLRNRAYQLIEKIAFAPNAIILAHKSIADETFTFIKKRPNALCRERPDKDLTSTTQVHKSADIKKNLSLTPWPHMKSLAGRSDIAYQATAALYNDRPPIIAQILISPNHMKVSELGDLKLFADIIDRTHNRGAIFKNPHAPNAKWDLTFEFDLLSSQSFSSQNRAFFSLQGIGYGRAEKHLIHYLDALLRHRVNFTQDETNTTILDFLINEGPTFLNPLENLNHAMNRAVLLSSGEHYSKGQLDEIEIYLHLQKRWQQIQSKLGAKELFKSMQFLRHSLSETSHSLIAISAEAAKLPECLDQIPDSRLNNNDYSFTDQNKFHSSSDEAWIIPGEVGTIAVAIPLGQLRNISHGAMHVVARLLELEFAWPALRLARGAYNINCEFNHDLNILCLGASCLVDLQDGFDALLRCGSALSKMKINEQNLQDLKRSTLSLLDGPQDPLEKHDEALQHFLEERNGTTLSRKLKHEIESCTLQELKVAASLIEKASMNASRVTIAPELLIKIMPHSDDFLVRPLELFKNR